MRCVRRGLKASVKCFSKARVSGGAGDTGEVDEVDDAGFLGVVVLGADELVERDGDDRVSAAARRIHVGRRHRSTRRTCVMHPVHHRQNVISAGWQVTLCDPIWHVSSCI